MTESLKTFWDLHKHDCFVIPNPWDIGTAIFLKHLGFKALATTSAGVSFSRGVPVLRAGIIQDPKEILLIVDKPLLLRQ